MKTESVFARLRRSQAAAYERAPAIREIFDRAGLKPADLKTTDDLARLSVFKKEALLAQQRENPPFGGFLAAREEDIARIFVSPGPINEPQFKGESDGHGFARVFSAANVGPGDLALNTWSYHLVPAGLLVDEGLRAAGSAVIPAGVGGSELQAKLVMELGVTCICASTAFFVTLAETIEGLGYALPESWKVKSALLGGELGDWLGKRRRLEARYGIRTFSVYATADFGVVGFESGDEDGYEIHEDRIVQICDPVTGAPLPVGQPGEIVVTTLNPRWPLIRLGTGDVAFATALTEEGTVRRIGMLQGRVGQAVKAREIFIYPRQLEELAISIPGISRAQAVVCRPAHREEITVRLVVTPQADLEAVLAAVPGRFTELSRLKPDHVEVIAAEALPADAPFVVDRKNS
jgi:phenylacetate-CoA ligase